MIPRFFIDRPIFANVIAIVTVIFGLVTVMGLIPGFNTVFGLMPIHGHDVWLHGLFAALAAFFGWRSVAAPVAKPVR